MLSPAFLEHEPPMLLGLSWSELSTLFFPSFGVWLVLSIFVALLSESLADGFLAGLSVLLVGEASTMSVLAIWFRRIRRSKSEGCHWHQIACGLHFIGWFKNIQYHGRWNI